MPREHENFRPTLEQLNHYVPGRELLTAEETMQIMGWKDPKTVRRHLGGVMVAGKVPKVALAKFLCR